MALILGVKTRTKWINNIAKTPIFGGIFLFVCMFIPPVILSFIAQALIQTLHDDIGFTKAMLILLPSWNLILWLAKIKLYLFYIPSWVLFGIIAIIKGILMITGKSDGQL
jgi:hypothetical protein